MSPLPQRRKSPEEISLLRESLGIPSVMDPPDHPPTPVPQPKEQVTGTVALDAPTEIIPAAVDTPVVSIEPVTRQAVPVVTPAAPATEIAESAIRLELPPKPNTPRPPTTRPVPNDPAFSSIPVRRHSHEELEDIRRRDALSAMDATPTHPVFVQAHPAFIASGYLFAGGCAGRLLLVDWPLRATAGCAAASLLIALCILILRPISRHHAGFIAILTLLLCAFATLQHFPQLLHAP